MKILMIAPTPFFADRGCHVRILEETKILQNLNHEVTIYTYHLGRDLANINIKRIKEVKSYKKTSAGPSYKKIYLDFLLLKKLIKEVKKNNYDIIHAHLHEGAFLAQILKKFTKTPIVFDYQGSLVKEMQDHNYLKNKLVRKFFQILENKITKSNDYILTSSTKSKEDLKDYKNVVSLIDAVDTNDFKPKNVEELKQELNLNDKRVVTYVGTLSKYQGTDLLLNSIPLVLKEIPNAHFIIAGYPNVEHYKELSKEFNENITFLGQIDYKKAPDYINLGEIAISFKLSATEANGKLYNYMACKVPVVATDNKINREILGDTALYVEPNIESCSSQIIKLLRDNELRKTLADKTLKKAVEEHSWSSRGETLEGVYKKCLESQ